MRWFSPVSMKMATTIPVAKAMESKHYPNLIFQDVTSLLRRESHCCASISGQVVWVISHTHSTGGFTERLIRGITQDNHLEQKDYESLILDPGWAVPLGGFVLLKSHCGDVCLSEYSTKQFVMAPDVFLKEYVENGNLGGVVSGGRLGVEDLRRGHVVHMVRDSFSSATAGYIYEWNVHFDANNEGWMLYHAKDTEGFAKW
eukprot:CAMPEP_0172486584 /NCGR_PEP_ID=MMETSP1066-20121228/15208_1 /TAXON_ID=671091 /ORGANISM="Coscinodiscus wailesii, Strain CCMP2513" /LENGTH=200 /DNA_ID=CAMNT_0013252623 /DNA_START=245 /DNA_END=844 /DNA_ORIENTATION=-